MTYKEAKEKADSLQNHVGSRVEGGELPIAIICAAPTEPTEKIIFASNIGVPPYMPIEEAMQYVLTNDFDVLVIFEDSGLNVLRSKWAKYCLPNYEG